MLNSEDADINKVIRQVIDLDKKAVRIKKMLLIGQSEFWIVQKKE